MKESIVDFHVHLADYEAISSSAFEFAASTFPSQETYMKFCKKYSSPDKFLELMNYNGVDYSVIMAELSPLTTGIATNDMVKEFCHGSPRLIPFCTLNPYLHPHMGEMLEDLCLNEGFRGVKLYPTYNYFYPNDNIMYPLYSVAERLNIPVLFHTGSSIFAYSRIKYGNPICFDDVAVDFPDMKIIMAHGGRGPWYNEANTMVRLHKNVFVDLAGLPPKRLTKFFPDMARYTHKFIFGTDWPAVDVRKNIQGFKSLDISPEATSRILGENAKEILGLD